MTKQNVTDPRIVELKKMIQDEGYVQDAIQRIAQVLSEQILNLRTALMSDINEGNRRNERHSKRGRGRSNPGRTTEPRTTEPGSGSRDGSPQAPSSGRSRSGNRQNTSPVQREPANSGRQRQPQPPRHEHREEVLPAPVLPSLNCPRCGQLIQDITSALTDRDSGTPVHFDCVLAFLQGAENIGEKEKIVYIGQGRFAVVLFEHPADLRKFTILRTIEWESREKKAEWREEIADQFSHVP